MRLRIPHKLRDYIVSERFIRDDLMMQSQALVDQLPARFTRDGKIYPTAFSWPAETVKMEDGTLHEGICFLSLDGEDPKNWSKLLRDFVQRTKAYGLLFIEQKPAEVVAIFESHHGSHGWHFPIRRHGDVNVLELPARTTDVESVGLLWSQKNPSS